MGAADEFVAALAAPAHLAVQFCRGIGHHAVFRMQVGLLPETAADIADQHADAFLRPLQDGFGQHVAGRARRLGLDMQDQPAGFLVDLGDGRARLHRGWHQPLADHIERDLVRSLGERGFDRGGVAIAHGGDDVVGRFRPHHGRARFCRLDGVHHRRQHLVFDRDRFGGGLRRDPRRRHHGGDRLTGKAHDFVGEQAARRHRHRLAVRTHEHQQRRNGADVVGDQVGAGVNRFDARHLACCLGVDGHDLRMRMRRAQHMQPQRALFRLVVDELPLPGEKSLVFKTLDRLARTKTHIAGKNIHQVVLRVFLLAGGVLADFGSDTTNRRHSGARRLRRHSGMRRKAQARNSRRLSARDSGFTRSLSSGRASRGPVGVPRNDGAWRHPISRSTASTALRSSAVSAACGATGSPTS